ncbi:MULTISPECIES: fumarylacetoacetate hydrolase family protein [Sphingomonas]|jgi:2-keto-4-pentenoate hydratase/2-oxohepta-3-ene-1,7-dioic acid hydratase in catechol pathway|uniref:Fumarylacetoacetate hydrolase family protein n=1 Tax=Sphingomonas zeae TaxID=1646122 RepID=A0A7Y6EGA5_9SPHN|nr:MULTISPECIES: fumarylacetoacetate hydrolase family protein [Sphingomonas]MBB4048536.1 2,4-diketo-3-deoxy-L-fuconate hydrolase [Sphingomonas zeae]MDK8187454.1 fumarylacetoacetate hydrolase family protein [Sphingomonas zeae]MDK8217188.1 fumarylacetoacetate hydrolase family protein [Sphingomonas sp. UMB7805-LC452B]NUU46220.1 fumarylacetoacetate hydrolase family protein [Sphingomonas zeae]
MKLLRYGEMERERAGLLDDQGRIRALPAALGDLAGDRLTPQGLAEIAALDPATLPVVEGNPRLGSCVARPGKFVCIGLNYRAHAAESNLPIPAEPVVFGKWSSAVVGPNDDVEIPRGSEKTDWEVELGVVIGTRGRYLTEAEALSHVAGYCVVHDVSEREFQLERGGTWDKGKGCDTFGPTGPWLVTVDEVGDPQDLRLWLEVDGKRYQDSSTADMIFSVAELVAYVSQFCTLEPGDIISTGTPEGVGLGQKPPVYLRAGQMVRLGIDKLGEQTQRMVAAG